MPHYENIKFFGYLGAREGGGGRGGARASKIRLRPYMVHIYPLLYINLHVKHGSNLIRTFWVKIQIMNKTFNCFRGHGGPLHKIQRYRGHQNVGKCRPHQLETYVDYTRENINNQFFIHGPEYEYKNVNFLIFRGPWGTFNDHTGPILLSRYHLAHSYK